MHFKLPLNSKIPETMKKRLTEDFKKEWGGAVGNKLSLWLPTHLWITSIHSVQCSLPPLADLNLTFVPETTSTHSLTQGRLT